MTTPSIRSREAIKTALAMTIAYAIALAMDWDRPYWAGFAVAFVSLTTVGQSVNKAALRVFGTLVAMAVALTLIALFSQQRWLFMLFLSAYMSVCCYLMSGSKRAYFWQVSGFVCVIICMDAGADSVNAFQTAILRAQETGLGILVYTLVAIFLWPSRSSGLFITAATELGENQHRFYRAYLEFCRRQENAQDVQRLSTQQVQLKARFDQLLEAAESDSQEIWDARAQWRRYQRQSGELMHALEYWRESLAETRSLDLKQSLPAIEAFDAELDTRLEQIAAMLKDHVPARAPQVVDLGVDKGLMQSLSHFDRASVLVVRTCMRRLEQLTRSLFGTVSELKGIAESNVSAPSPRAVSGAWLLDLDRLANAVRFAAILWLAWLFLIYVNDVPGGPGLVSTAGAIGIAVANMPQLPVSKLFVPASAGILFAAVLYIFVMPNLSSFVGLGLLIFAATFVICYVFADPRQVLGRAFGLAMFVTIADISNQQSYDFLSVANTAMMFPLVFLIFAITAHVPFSPRPERAFLRLLGRFFRSSGYLMSAMRWDPQRPATWLDRWKKEFHAREMTTLPAKLGAWAQHIDGRVLPPAAPNSVQQLVTSLQSLTCRMQHLIDQRDAPQKQFLVQALLADFRAWRLAIQTVLKQLAQDPASLDRDALRARVDGLMDRLEEKVKTVLNQAADGQLSLQDEERFYRLLCAYRSVSEALIDCVGTTVGIDWALWREARFS